MDIGRKNKILLFAGTTEGRLLAEHLDRAGCICDICVATEYGEELLLSSASRHHIHAGRLDEAQMEDLIRGEKITLIIDATHPYAVAVSENIRNAAGRCGCRYLRLLRETAGEDADSIVVDSVDEAVDYLQEHPGNVLAATGSRELEKYTKLADAKERVFARVLSTPESVEIAAGCGFTGKHLICMQGPFSEDMNYATLKSVGAAYMVTKESGKTGGFPEKVRAARRAGARLIVVGRPPQGEGYTLRQVMDMFPARLSVNELAEGTACNPAEETVYAPAEGTAGNPAEETVYAPAEEPACPPRVISLVGIGMGNPDNMTIEAMQACRDADLLAGAGRMLNAVRDLDRPVFKSYRAEEIFAYVSAHPQFRKTAVLLSGDVGFYSGAKKLEEQFSHAEEAFEIRTYCGISSVVYLCGKLRMPWEDVRLMSLHGRDQNLAAAVRTHRKVFALAGKEKELHEICAMLEDYGLGHVQMHVGCDLSYPQERIVHGTPGCLAKMPLGDLTAVLIENPSAADPVTHGIEDAAFERAAVPMTKEEIRSISLSKLHLHSDSILWDVGAGTGSVTIEAALRLYGGKVYAIEKKTEAAELIRRNMRRLGAPNVEVIEGAAPEALEDLPVPTHAFIGGSSGNMHEILALLLRKNPQVRIVINAIALETVAETLDCLRSLPVADADIAAVTCAKAKEIGRYHMMMGQNPVYVISCTGCADEGSRKGCHE